MGMMDKFKVGVKKLLKGKEDEPWVAQVREEARNEAIAEVRVELKDKFKAEEKKRILEGKKGGMEKAMGTLAKGFAGKDGGLKTDDKLSKMLGSPKSKDISSENGSGMINVDKILGNKTQKKRSIAEMMR